MKATVAELTKLPGVWRGGELEKACHAVVSTGHPALDRELPGGGWPTGTLSEVLHDGVGIGEIGFLAQAIARASEGDRMIAWINPPHLPYAPALAQMGLVLERCLVVRPANKEDALWATEQALRSGACGAVLFWLAQDQYAWLRRLQMVPRRGARWRCTSARPRPSVSRRPRICACCSSAPMIRCASAFRSGVVLRCFLPYRCLPLPRAPVKARAWERLFHS